MSELWNMAPYGGGLAGLPRLRNCKRKRESSWDRTGGNSDFIRIEPYQTAVLADISGAGSIRHIWFTIDSEDPHFLRKIVLRMFWDDETNPSVEVPVGDFFGATHGITKNFVSLPLTASPQDGRGFNCFLPMPFSKRARITVENESEKSVKALYYYIDYELYESLDTGLGRFHAWWNRERFTTPTAEDEEKTLPNLSGEENYLILEAEGMGHYIGVVMAVDSPQKIWYGEGDDMIFIDGEKFPPSLHGTGTEDYFCSAWCPRQEYSAPYHGYIIVSHPEERDWSGKTTMYRFHIEDPISFERSIRVTIEHGHANALKLDISSVAYWYQIEPHKLFVPIRPVVERLVFI